MSPITPRCEQAWSRRMRRRELSDYLREVHGIRLSPAALVRLACQGRGPAFHYDGRFPVTTPASADAFAHDRLGPERQYTGGRT